MNQTLDSRQLLAFTALARRGSFTLAAKDLFLTQSAVSHAIKALEEEVDCRLVDRAGKRVALTQAGEQFLRHAEKILREMESARAGLDRLSKWGHTRIRIGASTTACQYILPSVLREFRQRFPKCEIKIEPGDHLRQLDLLRSNQIDVAIMLERSGHSDLTVIPLFSDELRFIVAQAHPWAQLKTVDTAKIGDETLVLYNRTSYTFQLISDYFREEKVVLSNFIELGNMEAIKQLVKVGLGPGVLAPWVVRAELDAGSLISLPLGPRKLPRNWCLVHLKGRRLALGEETFIALCRAEADSLTSESAAKSA